MIYVEIMHHFSLMYTHQKEQNLKNELTLTLTGEFTLQSTNYFFKNIFTVDIHLTTLKSLKT